MKSVNSSRHFHGGHRLRVSRIRVRLWLRIAVLSIAGLFLAGFMVVYVGMPLWARHELLPAGSPAPSVRLSDTGGKTVDVFAVADGRPVLINFFDTECPECRTEVPTLCRVVRDHPEIYIVGVESAGHGAVAVNSFRRANGQGCLGIPLLLDPGHRVTDAYQVAGTPTAYLVKNGRISASAVGADEIGALVGK